MKALLLQWQAENAEPLRTAESLYFLSHKLIKQVAQRFNKDRRWAQLALELDAPPRETKRATSADAELLGSAHAPHRFVGPHREAVERVLMEWLVWA